MRDNGKALNVPLEKLPQLPSYDRMHEEHRLEALQHHLPGLFPYPFDEPLTRREIEGKETPLIRRLETIDHLLFQRLLEKQDVQCAVDQIGFEYAARHPLSDVFRDDVRVLDGGAAICNRLEYR